jgi:hypothetical protein
MAGQGIRQNTVRVLKHYNQCKRRPTPRHTLIVPLRHSRFDNLGLRHRGLYLKQHREYLAALKWAGDIMASFPKQTTDVFRVIASYQCSLHKEKSMNSDILERNEELEVALDGMHMERDDYKNLYHQALRRERQAKIEVLREVLDEEIILQDEGGACEAAVPVVDIKRIIKKLEEENGKANSNDG